MIRSTVAVYCLMTTQAPHSEAVWISTVMVDMNTEEASRPQ